MVPTALRAVDGVVLDAVLHLPVGARPRGVVVQAHGITADIGRGRDVPPVG